MKTKLLITAIICITAMLVLSVLLNFRQNWQLDQKDIHFSKLLEQGGQNTVTDHYTKDSITHTIYQEKMITNGIAEKEAALGKSYADSLQRALKVSLAKVDQATKIQAQLEARLALKEQPATETGRKVLSHRDKNLQLDYYPDTDSVKLAMDISLNEARYSKRKYLLGPRQHYIDISANDPRVTIKGLKSFTVKEKPQKRLGIGVSAGYGITHHNNAIYTTPYIGVGLNYNLIEF